MATDTFDDRELWDMANEASLDRPADPMMDDVETVQRGYHKAMAELALAHQEARENLFNQRQIYAMAIIKGECCDPELDLRMAELEGCKQEAQANIKRVCAVKLASVLAYHLSKSFHISPTTHVRT